MWNGGAGSCRAAWAARPISHAPRGGSPDGRAILALPATARGGTISRIVPRITAPTVSIPRDDTDLVITEHGVADLRGASLDARAQALIGVAAPAFRDGLAAAWDEIRRGM